MADEFDQYKRPASTGGDEFAQYKRAASPAAPQPTVGQEAWQHFKGQMTGAAEGAANTVGSSVAGTARALSHVPILGKYIPQEGIRALEARTAERSAPHSTDEQIGRTGEQIGEWLIPSGAEEHAAAIAPKVLGKAGPIIARIAAGSAESGLRNASQGGEFGQGAELGAGTGVLGEAGRAVAPAIAESALGIGKRQRGYGKTPGVAALEETKGIRPETIEKSARGVVGRLTNDINSTAAAHPGTVSIQPAIDRIDAEIQKALGENNSTAVEQLRNVRDQLTKEVKATPITTQGFRWDGLSPTPVTETKMIHAPIPSDIPASQALDLKRGLRKQFITNWNPETMRGTRSVAAGASGEIDRVLDNALGRDFASKNQRISSLIPVAERAESEGRNAGIAQRVAHRIGAHTGALAGAAAGGVLGHERAGTNGAILGGTLGLIAPEVLASPSTEMAIARGLHSGVPAKVLRGVGSQMLRRSDESKDAENK